MLDSAQLEAFLNMTSDEASAPGGPPLSTLLRAAEAHTEAQLGFKLTDETEFSDGLPADVTQAILMLAAHWFAQREATTVGVVMTTIPFGYDDIIRSHRRWTFG